MAKQEITHSEELNDPIPTAEPQVPETFNLGETPEGGLPEDLENDINGIVTMLLSLDEGIFTPDHIREALKQVETFEQYFADEIRKANVGRIAEGNPPYDEQLSLTAEIKRLTPEKIEAFNKKIAKLKELADAPELDIEAIKNITGEEQSMIYAGEKQS